MYTYLHKGLPLAQELLRLAGYVYLHAQSNAILGDRNFGKRPKSCCKRDIEFKNVAYNVAIVYIGHTHTHTHH